MSQQETSLKCTSSELLEIKNRILFFIAYTREWVSSSRDDKWSPESVNINNINNINGAIHLEMRVPNLSFIVQRLYHSSNRDALLLCGWNRHDGSTYPCWSSRCSTISKSTKNKSTAISKIEKLGSWGIVPWNQTNNYTFTKKIMFYEANEQDNTSFALRNFSTKRENLFTILTHYL